MIQASNEAGPLLQICTSSSIMSRSNILSNERLDEVVGNRKFFPRDVPEIVLHHLAKSCLAIGFGRLRRHHIRSTTEALETSRLP